MTNEEPTVDDTIEEEVTVEQMESLENLSKLLTYREVVMLTGILDGLSERFIFLNKKAEAKAVKKKSKRLTQYDYGYLSAFSDIFNNLQNLYNILTTQNNNTTSEDSIVSESFNIIEEEKSNDNE